MSFSVATDNGTNPVVSVFPDGRMICMWTENDANVYAIELDIDRNVVRSSAEVTGVGTVDPMGIAQVQIIESNGRPMTLLGVIQGGSLVFYKSEDGFAFA